MKGRVKWWSNEKGYGFIEYNDNENIFAYVENKDKNVYNIVEDQEIEFTIEHKETKTILKLLNPLEN